MNAKLKKSILVICLLCFATQAWAVRAKIRFLFPVSTKSVTDGFEDSELKTSEFVLAFLMPISRNTQLDLGYSYFNAPLYGRTHVSARHSKDDQFLIKHSTTAGRPECNSGRAQRAGN
jgi:hypothetical protein